MSRWKEITLAVGSVLLVLAGLEAWFRSASPQIQQQPALFEPDPELGWRFVPGRRAGIVHDGEARHFVTINADGFRDGPFDAIPPGARRILVLGDSFVSNLSVRDDEVFTERMEEALPGTSVMNLGVNGYSQVQQLLLLERALPRFRPDLVLVQIYARNDFTENVGARWVGWSRPTALAEEEGTGVALFPQEPQPLGGRLPAFDALMAQLHVAAFFRERWHRLSLSVGTPSIEPSRNTPPEVYLCRRELTRRTRKLYETTARLLLRIAETARQQGVPIAFGVAPSLVQVRLELWDEIVPRYRLDRSQYDLRVPGRLLAKLADERGLVLFDLLPRLRFAQRNGVDTYNPREQHWTAEGNRVAAEGWLTFLAQHPELWRGPAPAGAPAG